MTPADWEGFAEMTGGASGALTGLLFVAVSLNASRIAGHQGLRASAAQTLTLFITPLVMSAALLTPDQQLVAIFNRRGPNVMVMLLFAASGITLACGAPAGLYLLLPASLVAQISGVLNAWYFLLPPSPGSSAPSAQSGGQAAGGAQLPGPQALDSQCSMEIRSSSVSTGLVT
jgi:modulator of FtsH protease